MIDSYIDKTAYWNGPRETITLRSNKNKMG